MTSQSIIDHVFRLRHVIIVITQRRIMVKSTQYCSLTRASLNWYHYSGEAVRVGAAVIHNRFVTDRRSEQAKTKSDAKRLHVILDLHCVMERINMHKYYSCTGRARLTPLILWEHLLKITFLRYIVYSVYI